MTKDLITEGQLARFAKQYREQSGKNRAEAARDMKVAQVSIFRAEEYPAESLFKLRKRMIEKYSPYKVKGPVFLLEKK